MLIPADKTKNLFLLEKIQYHKLLRENITKHYKSADVHLYNINTEAKTVAEKLRIEDQMETMAKKAFITLKVYKENFKSTIPCQLINPEKSELGIVKKRSSTTLLTTSGLK